MHADEAPIGLVVDAHAAERAFHRKPLGFGHRLGSVGEQLLDHFDAGAFQLRQRYHLMHQTDAAGLLRIKTFAGQRVAANLPDADGVA